MRTSNLFRLVYKSSNVYDLSYEEWIASSLKDLESLPCDHPVTSGSSAGGHSAPPCPQKSTSSQVEAVSGRSKKHNLSLPEGESVPLCRKA